MRILIVSQYFWPESFVINSLASDLQIRNHGVSVLTGLPNYPQGVFYKGYSLFNGPWYEKYHEVQLYRVPLLARGRGFFRLSLNYLSFVISGCFFSIFRNIKKNDVIFCFALSPITSCLPAIFIGWLTKKPVVIWVQDLWPESVNAVGAVESQLVINLIGRLVKFIYKKCDVILIQSKAFKPSILQWGGDEGKISYIPNWADPFPEVITEPEWVRDLPAGFKIAFAGNIGKAQDMKTLVEAADLLKADKEIKWIIAGDGSDKAWLDQEIVNRQLQDCVYTVGKKPYSEMLPFFKKADAMLVSLTNEYIFSLTIPSKVQAYMASGQPIIASIAGEGARIINEAQAGVSCSPQNPTELAAAVLKMKNMTSVDRKKLGDSGKNYFEKNFERKIVIDKIEAIFQKLTE